jgi:hypothetical protein
MAWTTPKTDWDTNPKSPMAEDFNRIEENIDFLNTDIETKKGLIVNAVSDLGRDVTLASTHQQLADALVEPNLLPENIKAGKTIFGKVGTYDNTGFQSINASKILPMGFNNSTYGYEPYFKSDAGTGANLPIGTIISDILFALYYSRLGNGNVARFEVLDNPIYLTNSSSPIEYLPGSIIELNGSNYDSTIVLFLNLRNARLKYLSRDGSAACIIRKFISI